MNLEVKNKTVAKYPVVTKGSIMTNHDGSNIVIATADGKGIYFAGCSLKSKRFGAGRYTKYWHKSEFVPFKGSITLVDN